MTRRIGALPRWMRIGSAKSPAKVAKACRMKSAVSRRIISSRPRLEGGQNVPDEKRSFSKDHELASEAGRKGGQVSGGNFANDPEWASEAGRKGGDASHHKRRSRDHTGRESCS
jgi:general stress protein YciG